MFEGLLLLGNKSTVKSQRSYGFLITKELIFWLLNFGIFYHFPTSLKWTTGSKTPVFVSSSSPVNTEIKFALVKLYMYEFDMTVNIDKGRKGVRSAGKTDRENQLDLSTLELMSV